MYDACCAHCDTCVELCLNVKPNIYTCTLVPEMLYNNLSTVSSKLSHSYSNVWFGKSYMLCSCVQYSPPSTYWDQSVPVLGILIALGTKLWNDHGTNDYFVAFYICTGLKYHDKSKANIGIQYVFQSALLLH